METPDGPVSYVSREAFQEEVLRVLEVIEFSGGGLTIQTKRYPTGVPHESVTTGAVIQWWSHNQATSRNEPEQHAPLDDPTPEQFEAQLEAEVVREPEPVEG